jgi:hypothetical protein
MFQESDRSVWFNTPYHHFWKQTSGKTFDWFGTDSPRRYNELSGYSRNSIKYEFNHHGYRCEELQPSPILFIGCSYTIGIGLPLEDVWAHQVAKHYQAPYINLAQQGGSFSYFQRTLVKTLSVMQPQKVVLLYPYNWRFEMVQDESLVAWTASGVHSGLFTGESRDRLYAYEQFRSHEQEEFEILKSLRTIEALCKPALLVHSYWKYSENVQVSAWFERESSQIGLKVPTGDLNHQQRHTQLETKARDGSHPGRTLHSAFAQRVIRCISPVSSSTSATINGC